MLLLACSQGDLLAYLSPRLLLTLASFQPPSAASTATLQSGTVQSSFINAAGTSDTQQLHDEWKKIIIEFSQTMVSVALTPPHISTAASLHPLLPCTDERTRAMRLSGWRNCTVRSVDEHAPRGHVVAAPSGSAVVRSLAAWCHGRQAVLLRRHRGRLLVVAS